MPKGLQGFQKGHQTFISKERYKEIAKKRLGQKNALGKHWKLSEETKKRQSLASKGKKKNYPVWNKGKKGLIVGWNKGLKGMQKWHNISGLKKKGDIPWNKGIPMSEKTKEKIREGVIANPNKIFKDTTIERKIEEELRKNDIGYKKQVSLCKVAKVDFLLFKNKTIIQCDGDYWHRLPKHQERDARQDKVLVANGYDVYRFWESEINKSPEECLSRIKSLI